LKKIFFLKQKKKDTGLGDSLPVTGDTWDSHLVRAIFDLSFYFLLSFFVMQVAAFMLGQV